MLNHLQCGLLDIWRDAVIPMDFSMYSMNTDTCFVQIRCRILSPNFVGHFRLSVILIRNKAWFTKHQKLSKRKEQKYPFNRPWRPIGIWDAEAPTSSTKSAKNGDEVVSLTHRLPAGSCLALISLRRCVHARAIVQLQVLGKLKNPMTISEIDTATACRWPRIPLTFSLILLKFPTGDLP
jgi:hypothetical protein